MENFNLRRLEHGDIPKMLEWMHDTSISECFRFNSLHFEEKDCEEFIKKSFTDNNRNYAIIDSENEYVGTISLKNIDKVNCSAEYAIVVRKAYQGKGAAYIATKKILDIAFNELGLNRVYLNVIASNKRANIFYQKNNFCFEGTSKENILKNGKFIDLNWYSVLKREYIKVVKILEFSQKGDERGHLVIIEGMKEVPFDIKRIFYIYGSDQNVIRGQHANLNSEFVLINICGQSKVKVIDQDLKETIYELNKPHIGIYLPKMVWKDMYDFSKDSILLVLSSECYDAREYIRDFSEFKKLIKK